MEGLCPRVEVLRPGACAIAVRGPARYFGGEDPLAAKIIEAVAGCGLTCRVGIAEGLFAAHLAAVAGRTGRPPRPGAVMAVAPGRTRAFLAPLPVSVLDSPDRPDLAGLLPRLGVRTLGDFASLPAAEVANRFGAPGVLAHRLARGLSPRPLVPRPPPVDLSVCEEFDPPVGQAEPVVFAAKALAQRMHDRLAASTLTCVRVRVQVLWEDGREITRLWRHDGLLSALAVAERVRWQLAGWQPGQAGQADRAGGQADRAGGQADRAGGQSGRTRQGDGQADDDHADDDAVQAGGIMLLRLTPDQLVRDEGRQLGLWGDATVSDRVARAAIRVQAMLGHGAVTRPAPAGGRGPAEQVTLVPFGDISGPARPMDPPWPGRIPAPAPATVYPGPLPATIADDSGATVSVSGRGLVSAPPARMSADGAPWVAVTAWAGPWPVAERWWDPRAARRRARFQLVAEDGTAWLAVVQDGNWLIEAAYD